MSLRTFALMALATVALAHPKRHHHHHPTGTGTGGFMMPTGGPFSMQNNTGGSEFGAGSSSIPVEAATFTVVPLPASSTTPVAAASSPNVAVDAVNQFAAGTDVKVAAADSPCTPSSTFTSTVTSVQYYSVTVTGNDEAAAVPTSEFFALSSAATPSTTTALSLSTTASVAAGGFFQHPGGFGSSAASFSAVPTTFATSMLPSAASIPAAGSVSVGTSAPASTGTTTPSVASGGQKGLSYNDASLTDAFAGDGISWAYNWASSPGGTILAGAEYVPMLWGANSVSGWSSAAMSAISSGSSHLLSFNEPDLPAQSNLSPSEAATLHIANMNPLAGSAQIGSPAITNGAGTSPPQGINWLNQFFSACNGQCKVDFVAFHYYNDASQIDDFKSHVGQVIAAAQAQGIQNVWLTEFGASGADADVQNFLSEALSFLDSTPGVQRYAYFMASDGILLSGTSLSPLGEVYVS